MTILQPQTELIKKLADTINDWGLGDACTIGPLPPTRGISIELTSGNADTTYFDRREIHRITVLILCKRQSQKDALDTASAIRNKLTRLTEPLAAESFEWISAACSDPDWVGNQDGHIYACTAEVQVYF